PRAARELAVDLPPGEPGGVRVGADEDVAGARGRNPRVVKMAAHSSTFEPVARTVRVSTAFSFPPAAECEGPCTRLACTGPHGARPARVRHRSGARSGSGPVRAKEPGPGSGGFGTPRGVGRPRLGQDRRHREAWRRE